MPTAAAALSARPKLRRKIPKPVRPLAHPRCVLGGFAFEPNTRPFEPFRTTNSGTARRLVDECIAVVEAHEAQARARRLSSRERTTDEQGRHRDLVTAILCDLIRRCIETDDPAAGITMSTGNTAPKRTRYTAVFVGRTTRKVLQTLSNVGLVRVEDGAWGGSDGIGRLTEVFAGPRLLDRMVGLRLSDFTTDPRQEIIRLKTKSDKLDRKFLIDYPEDDHSTHLRDTMRGINDYLMAADLSLAEDAPGAALIDLGQRRLRRTFTDGSWKSWGRMTRGWWISLSKIERRAIRINGQPTTALDFGQMGIRILYGMAKAQPPEGDAYSTPHLRQYPRDGIKKVVSAAMFLTKELARWPENTAQMFTDGTDYGLLKAHLRLDHPGIAGHLFKGKGYEVIYHESECMIECLIRLRRAGIVALPVHDMAVVEQTRAEEAKAIMKKTFEDRFKVPISVTEE